MAHGKLAKPLLIQARQKRNGKTFLGSLSLYELTMVSMCKDQQLWLPASRERDIQRDIDTKTHTQSLEKETDRKRGEERWSMFEFVCVG